MAKTTIRLDTYDRDLAMEQRNSTGSSTPEQRRLARILLLSKHMEQHGACFDIGNSDLFVEDRHRRDAQRICDMCPRRIAIACMNTGLIERRIGTWYIYLNGRPRSNAVGDHRTRRILNLAWQWMAEVTGYTVEDLVVTFGSGTFGLREALEHFCGNDHKWWIVLREMLPDAG